jgi:queuosine precursor transporter
MNELVFFLHLLVNLAFLLGALRWNKKALVFFFVLESLLANLFVLKQILLFGLTVTPSDVYAVGAILALNLIREYYGPEAAKKSVLLTFFSLLFFLIMSQFQLYYAPSSVDYMASAYSQVLAKLPRLLSFSVIVFLIVQKLDLWLYSYCQKNFPKSFFFRLGGVSLFSQTIDTVLFSFLGLFGLVKEIWHVICLALLIKYVLVLFSASLIALIRKRVRVEYEF